MRWLASFRAIEGIEADRARQRLTLSYRFSDRFQAGLEWNPLADDWGPIGNFTALEETGSRPALILGTSSDRIGTAHGQAYYGTLSKSLEPWLGLPVAPYVGTSFRASQNDFELIGGLHYALFEQRVGVTHLWDGQNLHLTVDFPWRRGVIGLLLVQQEDPSPGEGKDYFLGLSLGLRLPGRESRQP